MTSGRSSGMGAGAAGDDALMGQTARATGECSGCGQPFGGDFAQRLAEWRAHVCPSPVADTPQPQDDETVERMAEAMRHAYIHDEGDIFKVQARAALAVARPLVGAERQEQIAYALDLRALAFGKARDGSTIANERYCCAQEAANFVRSLPLGGTDD
jgi:hypothetical protein